MPSSLPSDTVPRLAALRDLAVQRRSARATDAAARVDQLADLARSWLTRNAAEVRRELEQRVHEVECVGAPPSLFTLMGLSWYEKPYNRVLAWILDPAAAHGAGHAVLHALADHLGAAELVSDLTSTFPLVEVRGEQAWPREANSPRQPDLVVLSRSFVLLIENKVLSGESGDGQYADYLDALVRLAEARGTPWAAWLAAPERRDLPAADEAGRCWTGAVRHAEIATVLRSAASRPEVSAWGRVACLLVAAQLDAPEGHRSALVEAHSLLARGAPSISEIAEMRSLLSRLQPAPPPWSPEFP